MFAYYTYPLFIAPHLLRPFALTLLDNIHHFLIYALSLSVQIPLTGYAFYPIPISLFL